MQSNVCVGVRSGNDNRSLNKKEKTHIITIRKVGSTVEVGYIPDIPEARAKP